MCGLAGFLAGESSAATFEGLDAVVVRMAQTIQHRGPDDAGAWTDLQAGSALGHRRLSIVDLSAAGHQPMTSSRGRFVLAFNGEIYHHHEMRAELVAGDGARSWRGHSDTETLLAGFEHAQATALLQEEIHDGEVPPAGVFREPSFRLAFGFGPAQRLDARQFFQRPDQVLADRGVVFDDVCFQFHSGSPRRDGFFALFSSCMPLTGVCRNVSPTSVHFASRAGGERVGCFLRAQCSPPLTAPAARH